jgi:hypothetical protein
MKAEKGYEIVEPASLATLLGNPLQASVAVAVLEWAIARIKAQAPHLLDGVDVEIIPVTYMGTYPAIGLRYRKESTDSISPILSNAIDEFVRSISFDDFLSFVDKSNVSWSDVWQKLKEQS